MGGEPWAVGRGMWAVGCGLWAVGCGPWAVGCGLWAVGCGASKLEVMRSLRAGASDLKKPYAKQSFFA